jgi:hypothetical protein
MSWAARSTCAWGTPRLDLPDASFGTVVCTLSLCVIPFDRRAITKMKRVLRLVTAS